MSDEAKRGEKMKFLVQFTYFVNFSHCFIEPQMYEKKDEMLKQGSKSYKKLLVG